MEVTDYMKGAVKGAMVGISKAPWKCYNSYYERHRGSAITATMKGITAEDADTDADTDTDTDADSRRDEEGSKYTDGG